MSNVTTVQMSTLIDRALAEIQSPNEVSSLVTLNVPVSATTTQFDVTGTVAVTDVLEFGNELVLVTAVNDNIATVHRGYYKSAATTHAANALGLRNPQFARIRAQYAVEEAFARLEALGVPLIKSQLVTPMASPFATSDRLILDPGEEVREVLRVRLGQYDLDGWEFMDHDATVASGNFIRMPPNVSLYADEQYTVISRCPYRWDSYPAAPTATSTMVVPESAEHLPSSYAAAWLCMGREVSRHDLDRVSEWVEGEPTRAGVSARMVQSKWQDFYRKLDEVRRLNPVPKRRPLVRRHQTRLRG